MIRQDNRGNYVAFYHANVPEDFNTWRVKAVKLMAEQGWKRESMAKAFNVTRRTISTWLKAVPKDITPVFGSGEWTPDCQDQDRRTCNRCGGDDGSIQKGSKLYCAACHKSGFDRRLIDQLKREIAAEVVQDELAKSARKKTLAERKYSKNCNAQNRKLST